MTGILRGDRPLLWPVAHWMRFVILAIISALVFAAVMLSYSLENHTDQIPLLWLANAVMLVAFIRAPRRQWCAIALVSYGGNLLAGVIAGDPPILALCLPLLNVGEAWLGASLLLHPKNKPRRHVGRNPAPGRFLLTCVIVAPLVSACGATLLVPAIAGTDPATSFIRWFIADALGIAILAPLLLSMRLRDLQTMGARMRCRMVAIILLNGIVAYLVFAAQGYPASFATLPGLILAAAQTRFTGASLSLIVVAGIATMLTVTGHGPIAAAFADTDDRVLLLQCYIAVAIVTTLPIAAILAERARLTLQLAENERRYRLLSENANDIVQRIGLNGKPVYISGAATRILGFTPEELLNRNPLRSIHPDDRARVKAAFKRLLDGAGALTCAYRHRRRDSAYIWLEASCHLVTHPESGAPLEVAAIVRDIGQRREAELAALELAKRLEENVHLLTLAEINAGLGHWRLDHPSATIRFSDNACLIHGFEIGAIRTVEESINAYHPDDREMIRSRLTRALSEGKSISFRGRLPNIAGRTTVVAVEGKIEYDAHGSIDGIFGITQDITAQVQVESELNSALATAREDSRIKSDIISTISHEIRTQLSGFIGNIDIILSDISDKERYFYITNLDNSAKLLLNILDNILDHSKIDSGLMPIEDQAFDLRALIVDTIDLFRGTAARRGISIELHMTNAHVVPIISDPLRLQQILSNLISNALKFTVEGQIDVTVSGPAANAPDAPWRFTVSDTGIGITEEALARLFKPFVQADSSVTRRFGGTGLGLAICQRMVEAMGGYIRATSVVGVGSTFWFELPLKQTNSPGAGGRQSHAAPTTPPLRILLAEDNALIASLVSVLLTRIGHHVHHVADGRAAVDAMTTTDFDVVLMDLQMPGMDGIEATQAIRTLQGPGSITPIFALTADATAAQRHGDNAAGLSGFVTKPVDLAALEEILSSISPGYNGEGTDHSA